MKWVQADFIQKLIYNLDKITLTVFNNKNLFDIERHSAVISEIYIGCCFILHPNANVSSNGSFLAAVFL